jgi:catechol 2,3-dioxygenase-like lactoylglutathione lyase family enzyme
MKLGQVALQVSDLAQSVRYYRDVLGLPLLFEVPNLAFFDMGGVRLMLSAGSQEGERHESVLYYKVDDLQSAYQSRLDRGARSESAPYLIAKMPDHDLWMAFLRDPDNRLVGLMSEVRA